MMKRLSGDPRMLCRWRYRSIHSHRSVAVCHYLPPQRIPLAFGCLLRSFLFVYRPPSLVRIPSTSPAR
uniref:Uncharacterized protein n=1 Tax=Anopheles christyi TaxID=43041 RepID=A0A182KIB1_9DIPT